jgi:hypothetical protein
MPHSFHSPRHSSKAGNPIAIPAIALLLFACVLPAADPVLLTGPEAEQKLRITSEPQEGGFSVARPFWPVTSSAEPSILCLAGEGRECPKREPGQRASLKQHPADFSAVSWSDQSGILQIYSHFAGFVTNYPHTDGPYGYYTSVNEKMPLWGMASGGPYPGVADSMWIGGDFDSKYTTAPCGTPSDCYAPPPVDGMYRGWRTQGYAGGPCNCPVEYQRAYFSANRGVAMFDLSSVPDHATVQTVTAEGTVSKQFGSGERVNISQIEADRSEGLENVAGTGFKFTYDDASDGHLYKVSWDVSPYAVGNPAFTALNSTAVSDAQAALGRNWFGLGLVSGAGETAETSYYFGAFQGSSGVEPFHLIVAYAYIVPDPLVPSSAPPQDSTGNGDPAFCTPFLTWEVPNEEGGHNLHFKACLSDTVPVYFEEDFTDASHIDPAATDYIQMVRTATHDIYDETGAFVETRPPAVVLDPLELIYGGSVYPYAKNYNVGWRFGRPFISHLASDTWEAGGYSVDGLGDAMMGREYMEWSSDSAISYPDTACATELGYPANVTGIGGYIPAGITESFEIALEYDGDPGNYYTIATETNVSSAFYLSLYPPEENVTGVALFFTGSSDGYAYLADLQVYDDLIYDTASPQTVASTVVGSSADLSHAISHVRLDTTDVQPTGTSIAYELSNDDGATWNSVTPGTDFIFPTTGRQLRWRAHLSTTDRTFTPSIRNVRLTNLLSTTPVDSAAAPAVFEENATLGGIWQTMTAAGVPEFNGAIRQARYRPAGLADGAYYWKAEAYAPAGSTDPGAASPVWSFTMQAGGGTPPPDVGDVLMAQRTGTSNVSMQWPAAPPQGLSHYHVYRSAVPSAWGSILAHVGERQYTDTTAASPILYYRLRAADDCDLESAD